MTDDLKKYERMKADPQYKDLFRQSETFKLLDTTDERIQNTDSYGLKYESPFHYLIVDPVEDITGRVFGYERFMSKKGIGVATVPMFQGKFVLMKQYRHAIRDYQYSFVRGFGEPGLTPKQNALKEVLEELGGIVTKVPIYLGTVAPDAGMTPDRVEVYLVELDQIGYLQKEEGIQDVLLLSEKEMDAMIADDKLEDGITLSSYLYWKVRK